MTHPHPVGLAKKQNAGSEGWSGNNARSPSPCPTRPSTHPPIHPSYVGYGGVVFSGGSCRSTGRRPLDGRGPCREKSMVLWFMPNLSDE